jgi:uncharacterized Zn-binding protein involved in type VI secretion
MSRAAARTILDNHTCPLTTPSPHGGGMILPPGAPHTTINGLPAARVGDKALCIAPAMDTVRGGLITVFIDGSPASRELDKTDVGNILPGASPNVKLGEFGGGPLTPFQAQWLYDYMSKQQEIPFGYATDGCWVRADRMASYMQSLGIGVNKQWSEANGSSYLHVPIPGYIDDGTPPQTGGVTWGWHVAPVVQVAGPNGAPTDMVIDPSLGFGKPVTVGEWTGAQSTNPGSVSTFRTGPDVYQDRRITGDRTDTMRDPAQTAKDLETYRQHRANLPASTGRNVPDVPVHF